MNGRIRIWTCSTWIGLIGAAGAPALGQSGAAAQGSDPQVDLQAGIHAYLLGLAEEDSALFKEAGEHLEAVLAVDPDNRAALLFHSLAAGGIGLLVRGQKLTAARGVRAIEDAIDARSRPETLPELEQERELLRSRLEDEALSAADRLVIESGVEELDEKIVNLNVLAELTDESLVEQLAQRRADLHEAATQERHAYRAMLVSLRRLVGVLDSPEVVVRLLEVIADTKIARLNEVEALNLLEGKLAADQASAPAGRLRSEGGAILERTAGILEQVLAGEPVGLDGVKAKFFLGVIRFRQGVPRRSSDESPATDHARLAQAEQVMRELADDPAVERRWRSYAALYLGLIIPFRASAEVDRAARDAILDEAEGRLRQASELDTAVPIDSSTGKPDPAGGPFSRSNEIPRTVWRQRAQINELRARPAGTAQLRNDLQISVYAGAQRDTNVVLLGERTDLARDISRSKDFGFTTGMSIGYTWDIDDRWTLGLEGRVSQLWHADVDEFDEQNYGGSVALQYEAVPYRAGFGPVHLRLQYDYDNTLLGRSQFLKSHSISPNVRVFWADRRAVTEGYFRYELRDYFEPLYDRRFDRTGRYLALGVSQSYRAVNMTKRYEAAGIEPWGHSGDPAFGQDNPEYPARFLTPYIGFQYGWDQTVGEEFDQKSYVLALGMTLPLPWGLDLDAAVNLEWQDYQRGSLIDYHRRPRRDLIQRYEVALSRTFVLSAGQPGNRYRPQMDRVLMTLRAHAGWTVDDSNVVDRRRQAIFEYDRTIYGLSVAFSFN